MKSKIIKEFGFRWKVTKGKSKKNGNYIESIKLSKIRHKNVISDSMVS